MKKVFLKISQEVSLENTTTRVSFLTTLLKKRPWHSCFPAQEQLFL